MNLDLDIYNIFDLLKASYKNIDFRSAIYYKGHNWHRILSIFRFSNETETAIKEKYNQLDLNRYKIKSFKIQHEILGISKWEDKFFELYDEINEDIEVYDVDEFRFDNKKYHEFQSSFLDEFKINFSNPSRWFFFTEEEVKNHNLINFYYNVSDKNEHHNQFNKFLNDEIKVLGEDNIYNVLNRTLQLQGYGSQNSLFISSVFPIYMKISDLNYNHDNLTGKVQFHEIFENTRIFFRIYSNPNYHDNSLEGWEVIDLSKDDPNTKEIDNGIFETTFSLDFKKYDCFPIFEIRARWENLPKLYLIDFQHSFDTPRFQQFYKDIATVDIEERNDFYELTKKQEGVPHLKDLFIKADFKNYQLSEYDDIIELINLSAYDNKYYRILPILLRNLFENLLYDIFQTGLNEKHTDFFFLKSQNRAQDFSKLIALMNILKDREFKPFHKDSINQDIIDVMKEIQKFGNWTVHQILRQVDKDFADKWKDRINRVLNPLLVLYRKIKDKAIEIKDQSTLEIINKTVNPKNRNNQVNARIKSRGLAKEAGIQEYSKPLDIDNILNSHKILLGQKFKNLYNRLTSKNPEHVIIDIKTIVEDIGKIAVGKILRMEYVTEKEERIMLIEPQKWNLSIRTGSNRHLRLQKYVDGNSQIYDFEFPNQNEEILDEFLKLVKDRCKEQGFNV